MKHIHIRIIFGFCLIAVFALFYAATPARAVSFDSLVETVTNPFDKFVDEAEKTIASSTPRIPSFDEIKNIDVKSFEPGTVFENLKNWAAKQISGEGGIARVVKKIGNLIADILSYIANFLRRALELLP